MNGTILIVDDERNTREGLQLLFDDEYDVYIASNEAEALEALRNDTIDVLITDLRLGGDDGLKLIDKAREFKPAPVCILMTAYGSVEVAVEAMKRGAYDYVTKPLNLDELEILVKRALHSRTLETENRSLKQQFEQRYALDNIIGSSAAMQHVFETIRQIAPSHASVLIEGESGTGKELVAKAIHNLSGRAKDKLVTVHCAAFSPQLLESELFGHEKGAFTGAIERRVGRFEQADKGTIFLDEIGEIDSSTQVKLLRVLGEGSFERVGGNKTITTDARLVAATNRNLAKMVMEEKFREDLYFRLNTIRLTLPPLRERKEDIPLLVQQFLKDLSKKNRRPEKELSAESLPLLMDYDWPGNIRELRSAVEHAVVMSNTVKILPRHFPETVRFGAGRHLWSAAPRPILSEPQGGSRLGLAQKPSQTPTSFPVLDTFNLAEVEKKMIILALKEVKDNRTEAAKLLGISRRTLHRKLHEYGLETPEEG